MSTKKIKKYFIFPLLNIKKVIRKAEDHLNNGNEIIEVVGFPIRVFCFKKPEFIKQVFSHPEVGITKAPQILPRVAWAMKNQGGYILSGGDEWKTRRHTVQAAFHSQLNQYISLLPPLLEKYIANWEHQAEKHAVFDIFYDLRKLIVEYNFKKIFNADLTDEEVRTLEATTLYADLNFVKPTPMFLPTYSNIKFKKSVNTILKTLNQKAALRLLHAHEKKCIVDYLLEVPLKGNALTGELASIYFGASVMGTTLAWAFSLIGSNPEVMRKLSEEARAWQPHEVTREKLMEQKYSTAVMKEVLRHYPPSWGYPRFNEKPFALGDYQVPAKSLVIPMVYLAQMDPANWQDPQDFKPDRFLADKSQIEPFSYLPFGAGPRACMGGALAPYVMQLVILLVSRKMHFKHCPRYPGDPISEFGFEIHPEDKVNIQFMNAK